MNNKGPWLAAAMMIVNLSPAWAQGDVHDAQVSREPGMAGATDAHSEHTSPSTTATEQMNHDDISGMEEMDMEDMDMTHEVGTAQNRGAMSGMNHDGHGAMPDEAPLSGLRDPHAYADGYDFNQFPMRHEEMALKFGLLLVDRLEAVRTDNNTSATYDLTAWYGGNFDRAVLKAEGDVDNGKLQDGRTEVLWGHAVTPFWDTQLGLRYDNGVAPDRGWLAFGIQGLAPYWFEVNATAYVGDKGRTALRLDGEYDLLLTQKLILQPRLEADFYGKRDAERTLGSGLSDLTAGIRLRYEIRREFVPYIGVEWASKHGGTADYARVAGQETAEARAVAGVRFWF